MRDISIKDIILLVEKLCIQSNCLLNNDILDSFETAVHSETSKLGKEILQTLIQNAKIAKDETMPICQDTGMTVVFVTIGQEVHITHGNLADAINQGVRQGYEKGYLRKSIVNDPIQRKNTKDNTPAVIYYDIVPGDIFHITVAPKGFGSENMSQLKMLKPSDGIEGIKKFVLQTIQTADSNPCPPIIVGIGIGGTMDKCALLAKQALLKSVTEINTDDYWANIEKELLEEINNLNIGPAGFGGKTTALAVHINTYPTHIAGLPVAVNIGCHVTRHAEGEL